MRTSLLALIAAGCLGAGLVAGVPTVTPSAAFTGAMYSGFKAGLPNSGALNGQVPAPITARQGAAGVVNTPAGLVLNCPDGSIVSQQGRTVTIGAGSLDRADIAYVRVGLEGGTPVVLTQRTQDPVDRTIGYRFQIASNPLTRVDGRARGWADIVPVNGYPRRITFWVVLNTFGTYQPVAWYADPDAGTDDAAHGTTPGAGACRTLSRAMYNGALALATTGTPTNAAGCFFVQYKPNAANAFVEDFNLPQQATNLLVEVRPDSAWGNPSSVGGGSVVRTYRVAMDAQCLQDWLPPLKGSAPGAVAVFFYNLAIDQVTCPLTAMGTGNGNATYEGVFANGTFPNPLLDTQQYFADFAWYSFGGASQGIDGCFPGFHLIGCSGRPYATNQFASLINCSFTHHSIDFLQIGPNAPSFRTAGTSVTNDREFYDVAMQQAPVAKVWRDTVNQRVLAQIQPTPAGYVSFTAVPITASGAQTLTLPDGLTAVPFANRSVANLYLATFWADSTSLKPGYHAASYRVPVNPRWILGDGHGTVFANAAGYSVRLGPNFVAVTGVTAADAGNLATLAASGARVPVGFLAQSEGKSGGYQNQLYVLSGAAATAFQLNPVGKPACQYPAGDVYQSGSLASDLDAPPWIMVTRGSREGAGNPFDSVGVNGTASNISPTCKITASATGITTADAASGATGSHRLLPISRVVLTTLAYLRMTAQPVAGDALTLVYGGAAYPFTFQSTVTNAATQIQIGASVAATLSNLLAFLQSSGSGLASTNTFALTSDGTAILCNVTSKTGAAVYGDVAIAGLGYRAPGSAGWVMPASGAVAAYSPYADCGLPSAANAAPWITLADFDAALWQPWLKPGFTDYAGNAIQVSSEGYAQSYPPIPAVAWYEQNLVNGQPQLLPSTTRPTMGTLFPIASTVGLVAGDVVVCGGKQHPDIQQFNSNIAQAGSHENPMWVENAYMQTTRLIGNFQRFQSNDQPEVAWGTVSVVAGSPAVTFVPPPGLGTMTLTPKAGQAAAVNAAPIAEVDGSVTYSQTIGWNEPSATNPLYCWNNVNLATPGPVNPRVGTPHCGHLFLKALSGPYAGQLFQILSQTPTTTTIVLPVATDGAGNQVAPQPITFTAGDSYALPPPFQRQQVLGFNKTNSTAAVTSNDRLIVQSDTDPMTWTATRPFQITFSGTWTHKQNTRSWINHAGVFDVIAHAMTYGPGHVDYGEIGCTDNGGVGFSGVSLGNSGFVDGLYSGQSSLATYGVSANAMQGEPEISFRGSQIGSVSVSSFNGAPAGTAATQYAQTNAYLAYLGTVDTTITPLTLNADYSIAGGVTQAMLGLLDGSGNPLGRPLFPWDALGNPRTTLRPGAMD